MPRLLICYRRDDAAPYAGRLFDKITQAFGERNVLMDVDTIPPGEDFARYIQNSLKTIDGVLVVIGPRWLDARDAAGNRRLLDERDHVRCEIAAALELQVRVVPVLVGGATLPEASRLPANISALTTRNAVELRDSKWGGDIAHFVKELRKLPRERRPIPPKTIPKSTKEATSAAQATSTDARSLVWKGLAIVAVGLTLATLAAAFISEVGDPANGPPLFWLILGLIGLPGLLILLMGVGIAALDRKNAQRRTDHSR